MKAALLPLLTLALHAQSFDVASLKPVHLPPGPFSSNLGIARNGQVTLTNVTLADCLRFAYSITNDAQIEGPAWIRDRDVRFTILAKALPDTPRPQLLVMLQSLLTERFQLALHHEPRPLSSLAITIARNGPKIQRSRPDSSAGGNRLVLGALISNQMTMPTLATLLSRYLRQTALDRTGLKGLYEIKLEWTPDAPGAPTEKQADLAAGPSIFAAVQEQLGLKLESHKEPLDVLVIDRAEKVPLGN